MGRWQLVAAAAVTVVVCVAAAVPALASGTWPASVQLATSAAPRGHTVTFSGQGPAAVGFGKCVVILNKAVPPAADCFWDKAGAISGAFDVPADAATGTAAVSVCWPGCYDDSLDDVYPDYWQANTRLKIVAPFVDVPNVTCLRINDATARLTEAGWDVLVDREMGDVVTDQEPRPGAQLQQTVPIVLFLRGVPVPELVGSTYDEARTTLEESCLAISAVDGIIDGAVELQDPSVATLVPGGTTVNVTMSGSTKLPTPASPTPAPSTPASPTPASSTPASPTPASSTPASPTPVTNGPSPDPVPTPVSFPVTGTAQALGLLLAVMLAGGLLARAIQHHRGAAWVTAHVSVMQRPGLGTTFEIRPSDERDRDHVITVVPREARRSTTVKENPS
jgi:cell division septation protein DedD